MKNNKVKLMCLAGVLAAVVFVLTAYLHIPSHTGYTHIGDAVIYIAACLLPFPYAAAVGAMGALLADCLTGFAIWAPASVIIKTATVLCFTCRKDKMINLRNILGLIPAGVLCVGGYYLYDSLITGSFIAPLSGIPGYITQWVLSSAVFIALGIVFDKINVKKYVLTGGSR